MSTPTMNRFLLVQKKKPPTDAEVGRIEDAGAAALNKPKTKRDRKTTDWFTWSEAEKKACAQKYRVHGLKYLKNAYGDRCPPSSTVRTWCNTLAMKGQLRTPGRPRWLSDAEEEKLYKAVVSLRRHGCIIDRETLLVMASEASQANGSQDRAFPMSLSWSKGFRCVCFVFCK